MSTAASPTSARSRRAKRPSAASSTSTTSPATWAGWGSSRRTAPLCMISVLINTHLLMAGKEQGVERHFYSSSACVYNVDLQRDADRHRVAGGGRLPGAPRGRLRLGEALLGAHVQELLRRLRHRDTGGALPQRLRAARHLRRRPGEGARRDLPQGRDARSWRAPTRSRSGATASRRGASCTSTTASTGTTRVMESDILEPDQPRLGGARDDQPARRHRRRDRGRAAEAALRARRAEGRPRAATPTTR